MDCSARRISAKQFVKRRQTVSGVALLTALGLLFIFSMLGVAYVGYATNTLDRAQYDARLVRARHVARGGIEAAIGKIQSALLVEAASSPLSRRDGDVATTASGNVADVLSVPLEYESPLYQFDREAPEKFSPATDRRWATKVTVTDESGKVNLNCAPPRVLQAILGVDGDTARKIRSSLPLPEAAAATGQSWLTSMDDLVTRGLMPPVAYDAVPKHLVTVYTVADPARPVEFLNVNAAPPRVLAAILDVTFETAQQAAQKRPFNSLADLSAAAGKDPMTFNIKPASDAPGALPRELSLRSRCFRIKSQAELMVRRADGSEESTLRSRAEAVVIFGEGGAVQITYSSEAPQRDGAG